MKENSDGVVSSGAVGGTVGGGVFVRTGVGDEVGVGGGCVGTDAVVGSGVGGGVEEGRMS